VADPKSVGYDDTPVIQNQQYKVHDGSRPQPRVVTPPTPSTQDAPGSAPSDAVVLFDGSGLDGWVSQKDGGPAGWKLVEGQAMEVVPGSGGIVSKETFGDCQLHVEWAAPAEVKGDGQGRGNSGVFLMNRYEIQVLDCYDNPTYPDGTAAGIYGQWPPLVNACRKPGDWQTYDIIWIAPRFEGERLISPARVTVIHNGLVVHHDKELNGPTQHRQLAEYSPHGESEPLSLQDHGDLVRYRNIWYRPLKGYDE
jgi:hypothetical protein